MSVSSQWCDSSHNVLVRRRIILAGDFQLDQKMLPSPIMLYRLFHVDLHVAPETGSAICREGTAETNSNIATEQLSVKNP